MDLGTNLIFLVVFGVFGFAISNISGVNPYRIFSDIVAAIFIILLFIAILPGIFNPENALDAMPNVVEVFANNFPGIVIGDIAGSIIGVITGG